MHIFYIGIKGQSYMSFIFTSAFEIDFKVFENIFERTINFYIFAGLPGLPGPKGLRGNVGPMVRRV